MTTLEDPPGSDGWNPDEEPPHHTDADVPWDIDGDLPAPSTYKLNGNGHKPQGDDGTEHTSWWPTDLSGLFDGSLELPEPTIYTRDDGQAILYPGKCHAFNGESESGKSWAALVPCVEQINADNHVWYLDFEDSAATLVTRLLALGAKPEAVVRYLHYASPSEALIYKNALQPSMAELIQGLELSTPTLAVIDGVTEAMTMHGLDLNSNQDYATFHNLLPRRLSATGAAVVNIDHVTKNTEGRGRWALGAQHKLAGMDGAVFSFEVIRPFGLGLHGIARLVIQKDRPGQLRRHAKGKGVIAEFHLDSDPDTHALKATLQQPPTEAELENARDQRLMSTISHWLAMHPGEHSHNAINDAIAGRKTAILDAIDALVPDYATSRRAGRSTLIGHLQLYRPGDDDT